MHILGEKKRKRALKEFKDEIKEISELYFQQKEFIDKKKDNEIPTIYYVYNVSEVCQKFRISVAVLHFLVLHHCGTEVRYCEFCGHTIKKIKFRRSSRDFIDDCRHTGICKQCGKPCQIDEYGFCFSCNPKQYETPEMSHLNTPLNYIMGYHLGRNSFSEIQNRETLKALRVYAMELVHHLEYLLNP